MIIANDAAAAPPRATLLSAPLELGGEWRGAAPNDVIAVVSRMREACLAGIRLLSDGQPAKLRIDDHGSGPPAIWLHEENPDAAWVIVDVGASRWSQLAYQFGHELGHVLCNSWKFDAKPGPPSQWLEEAMVEAFSIRGLALLANSWERNPPFPNDAPFAKSIRQYRAALVDGYMKAAPPDLAAWLRAGRPPRPDNEGAAPEGPAVAGILAELEQDKACVEDLGAANRWPARTGAPVEDYLRLWQSSCAQIDAPGVLPARLKRLFDLS